MKDIKRIAVTGGCGQIAYSLLFRIASGEMLGKDQPIALHILDLEQFQDTMDGLVLELEDCCYPLLKEIKTGSDPKEIFKDVDIALLVGSKPRGPGMERKDLLNDNGKIFEMHGKALNEAASKEVKVFVVGNPCNTNCLIVMNSAPNISRGNFFAMTRLDQNRAKYQLANKANVPSENVKKVIIWGNHSTTQVPDFYNAEIDNKKALEVINDEAWLKNDFLEKVQKRGSEVIKKRGKSSAASAANAIIDSIKALYRPTPKGDFFSLAVCSDNNSYGIEEDLIFSFPCISKGDGNYEIVKDLELNDFLLEKIKFSQKELIEEKNLISHLLSKEVNYI